MADTTLSGLPELETEYELLTELGRGGMAVVYLARDRQLGREVAIKVIHTGAVDAAAIEQQLREARTVAQLQHPNVVAIYAVKQLGARGEHGVAMVMQYIPGRGLDRAMREDGLFAPERAEAILADITAALAYAHARGVIHRDIKPANIFLNDETGRALLSDFGIALSAESRRHDPNPDLLVGTPAYMSPEQIDDLALDGRSDLFSLGLVGYEMLSGVRPWIDEAPSDVLFRQRFEPLPALADLRADIPDRLRGVIERAVAKDRDDRWPSAVAMLGGLTDDEWVPEEPAPSHQAAAQARLAAGEPAAPASAARPTPVHTMVYRRGMPPPSGAPQPAGGSRPAPERTTAPYAEEGREDELPPLWERPRADRRPWLIALPVVLIGAAVIALAVAGPNSIAHYLPAAGGQSDSATRDSLARAGQLASAQRSADSAGGVPALAGQRGAASSPATDSAAPDRAPSVAVTRDAAARLDSLARATARHGGGAGAKAQPDTPGGAAHGARLLGGIATNDSRAPFSAASTPVASPLASARAPTSSPPAALPPPPPPPAPVAILPPLAATVAAGGTHTCALTANGGVACWGGNDRGQLGVGGDAHAPVPTPLGSGPFTQIAAGLTHTCGVLRSGGIECWGANDYGQLGDSSLNAHSLPQRLTGSSGRNYRFVAVGMAHSCALAINGDVFCWGRNNVGQLGDGSVTNERAPVRVASSTPFVALSVGWNHACALTAIGQAYCWGQNADGQLGDGTTVLRTTPVPVGGGIVSAAAVSFRAIAAGGSHSCALGTDGQAYCWGRDMYGQLGDGDLVNRAMPTRVVSNVPFVSITAGGVHSCALSAMGQAFCWGRNTYGQLGDGSTNDHPVPVAVHGAHVFRSLNASGSHTCGRSASNVVMCWGYNSDGQLGDGTTSHHSEPVQVAGLQ